MCLTPYIHVSVALHSCDTLDTCAAYHDIFDMRFPEPFQKNRPRRLQFYADNVGLFFGVNTSKDDYATTYERLRCFVEVFFFFWG